MRLAVPASRTWRYLAGVYVSEVVLLGGLASAAQVRPKMIAAARPSIVTHPIVKTR